MTAAYVSENDYKCEQFNHPRRVKSFEKDENKTREDVCLRLGPTHVLRAAYLFAGYLASR